MGCRRGWAGKNMVVVALGLLLLAGCAGSGPATGGAAISAVTVVSSYQHRERNGAVVVNGRLRNESRRAVQNIAVKAELRGPDGTVLGTGSDRGTRLQPGEMQEYRIVISNVPVGRELTRRVWIENADF